MKQIFVFVFVFVFFFSIFPRHGELIGSTLPPLLLGLVLFLFLFLFVRRVW
ncbi:hypothetical protein GGR50DRAFT_654083 [Xylaria sp. CBS 124048]|nr:hypothetical protein GGR50DRAFT_654083 [Xylaria sp. CBS 124048]